MPLICWGKNKIFNAKSMLKLFPFKREPWGDPMVGQGGGAWSPGPTFFFAKIFAPPPPGNWTDPHLSAISNKTVQVLFKIHIYPFHKIQYMSTGLSVSPMQ